MLGISEMLKRCISIGFSVVYIDTGSPVPSIPSKSRGVADKNEKILTEWKLFKTSVFVSHVAMKTNSAIDSLFDVDLNGLSVE